MYKPSTVGKQHVNEEGSQIRFEEKCDYEYLLVPVTVYVIIIYTFMTVERRTHFRV